MLKPSNKRDSEPNKKVQNRQYLIVSRLTQPCLDSKLFGSGSRLSERFGPFYSTCFHLMEVYYNFNVLDFSYTMINALRVSTLEDFSNPVINSCSYPTNPGFKRTKETGARDVSVFEKRTFWLRHRKNV